MKWTRQFIVESLLGVSVLFWPVAGWAVDYSWTQTDWSGGVGTNTSSQYDSASNVVTTTAGEITLASVSSWYNTNWLYRKQLTLVNTQSENLTNFPVLVSLSSGNFDFTLTQSAGQDIRFTDANGTTLLNYEIEQWSASTTTAKIWVNVPQVDSGSSDFIYMYYGNSSASDGQSATATWNSNYQAVYHLSDTLATSTITDSTGNNNDGIAQGGMSSGNVVSGQVGGAVDFDGTNDYIAVATAAGLDITDDLTLEAWLKADSAGTQIGHITDSVVDQLEFDTSNGQTPSMVQVTGSVYAVAYTGSSSDGFIATVTIDSNGVVSNSVVDTLEFDTSDGFEPSLVNVTGDIYAVAYRGPSSDGFIKTVTIDSSGNISNSVVDTLEFDTSNGFEPSLVNVTGDVYAVAYEGSSGDGFMTTLTIDSAGAISNSVVDAFEFDTSNGQDCSVVQVSTGVYAVAYKGANSDGYVVTMSISSSGAIGDDVIDSYEFDTSEGTQPHMLALGNDLYTVGYAGSGSDGYISTIEIVTRRGLYKGDAYGIDGGTTTALGTINDQTVSTSVSSGWNHVVLSYDNDTTTSQKLYINGSLASSGTMTDAITTATNDLWFGQYFDGQIDEIRVSSGTVRSAAWIAAAYTNMTSSSFVTFGSEQQRYESSGSLTSAIYDTGLTGVNWGVLSYTVSSTGIAAIKVRTGNSATLSDATAFSGCTAVTSGVDISSNSCVSDDDRYIQYEITATPSSGQTPIWQDITIAYAQPAISFSVGNASGAETSSSPTITVALDAVSSQTVTASYAVSGSSTATGSGVDYSLVSGTATISAGSTSTTLPMTVTDDEFDESDETIIITLSSPVLAALGSTTTTTYTIIDDDTIPTADNQALTTTEDTSQAITVTGSDADGDTLTYAIATQPTHGTLGTLNTSTGAVTYTPTTNYNGTDSFTFTVSDGTNTSSAATITLTIASTNDGPVANAGTNQIVTEDDGIVTLDASGSTDPEGDVLSYLWTETTDSADGCSITSFTNGNTTVTLNNKDSSYSCIFALTVSDGTTTSSTDSVVVNIVADNDAPAIAGVTDQFVQEGSTIIFGLSASDVDSTALSLTVADAAGDFAAADLSASDYFVDHGDSTGTFTWQPTTSQAGTYRITVLASDAATTTSTTMNVAVANTNQAPNWFAVLPNVAVMAGTSSTVFDLDDYVLDPDGDAMTYSVSGEETVGVGIVDGVVTITAPDTFTGTETIRFTATDVYGLSQASIAIVLNVTLPAPTVENFGYSTGSNSGTGTISIYDDDGQLLAEWQAFPKGGVIPRVVVLGEEYYIFAIKRKAGSTLHVYSLDGAVVAKQRLSPKLHWRKIAVGDFISDNDAEEIVIGSRRGSKVFLKIWTFSLTDLTFVYRDKILFDGIQSNHFRIEVATDSAIKIIGRNGRTLHTWRPEL